MTDKMPDKIWVFMEHDGDEYIPERFYTEPQPLCDAEYTRTALVDELIEALGEQLPIPLISTESVAAKIQRARVIKALAAIQGDKE